MTTSDKIRVLIEERGLSQQQFAGMVGIHHITLNRNLAKNNFSSKSLEKIASACGYRLAFTDEAGKAVIMFPELQSKTDEAGEK